MKADISKIKWLANTFGDSDFNRKLSEKLRKMSSLDKMDLEAECNVAKMIGGDSEAWRVLESYVNK